YPLQPPHPPRSTLFPYTTLFRSHAVRQPQHVVERFVLTGVGVEAGAPEAGAQCGGIQPDDGLQAGCPVVAEHDLLVASPSLEYRSEEHTSELQSRENLVCRLLLE